MDALRCFCCGVRINPEEPDRDGFADARDRPWCDGCAGAVLAERVKTPPRPATLSKEATDVLIHVYDSHAQTCPARGLPPRVVAVLVKRGFVEQTGVMLHTTEAGVSWCARYTRGGLTPDHR